MMATSSETDQSSPVISLGLARSNSSSSNDNLAAVSSGGKPTAAATTLSPELTASNEFLLFATPISRRGRNKSDPSYDTTEETRKSLAVGLLCATSSPVHCDRARSTARAAKAEAGTNPRSKCRRRPLAGIRQVRGGRTYAPHSFRKTSQFRVCPGVRRHAESGLLGTVSWLHGRIDLLPVADAHGLPHSADCTQHRMAAVLQAGLNGDQRCHCKYLGTATGQAQQPVHNRYRLDGADPPCLCQRPRARATTSAPYRR